MYLTIPWVFCQFVSIIGIVFLRYLIKAANIVYQKQDSFLGSFLNMKILKNYVLENWPHWKQKLFFGGLVYLEEEPTKRFFLICNIGSAILGFYIKRDFPVLYWVFYFSLISLVINTYSYYCAKNDLNIYSLEEIPKKLENFDSEPE